MYHTPTRFRTGVSSSGVLILVLAVLALATATTVVVKKFGGAVEKNEPVRSNSLQVQTANGPIVFRVGDMLVVTTDNNLADTVFAVGTYNAFDLNLKTKTLSFRSNTGKLIKNMPVNTLSANLTHRAYRVYQPGMPGYAKVEEDFQADLKRYGK